MSALLSCSDDRSEKPRRPCSHPQFDALALICCFTVRGTVWVLLPVPEAVLLVSTADDAGDFGKAERK